MLLPDAGRGIFHRAALFQRVLEILLNVPDTGCIHHPDGIFKVMVQAAVVQVDGPHHGDPAIHQPGFCVQKARREGVDLDPRADQRLKVAAGQLVNHLFIRDAGGINAHIHAALCGQAQCRHGGVIQD